MQESIKAKSRKPGGRLVAGMGLTCLAVVLVCFGVLYAGQRKLAAEDTALKGSGSLEATEITVAFKVPGKVARMTVDEGERVKQGQVLAVLESREIEAKGSTLKAAIDAASANTGAAETQVAIAGAVNPANVNTAESMLRDAQASLQVVEKNYQRVEALFKEGAVSQSQLEQVQLQYTDAQEKVSQARDAVAKAQAAQQEVLADQQTAQAAKAQLDEARAAYNEVQVNLDNTVLKSPVDGIVTQRAVDAGEMVNAGTPVFNISNLDRPWVKVYIDESKIGKIKEGDSVRVTFDAFPGRVFKGKVLSINSAGDFAVRKAVNEQRDHDLASFAVKVGVDNPDQLLKAGMTAYVDFKAAGGEAQ